MGFLLDWCLAPTTSVKARKGTQGFNSNQRPNRDDINGAVIMAKPLREFTRFIWWLSAEEAADPRTKLTDLDCESARKKMAATVHIHHRQSQPNKVGLKWPFVHASVHPQKVSSISMKFGM